MAKAIARLADGYRTTITARDHTWYADEPESDGGTNTAPTPMEMLRGALGGCIAVTLRAYAERKRWPLEGVEAAVDIERFNGSDYPDYDGEATYVHEFRVQVVLHGPLTDEQRARLMEIAARCPVRRAIATPSFFKEELLEAETLPAE